MNTGRITFNIGVIEESPVTDESRTFQEVYQQVRYKGKGMREKYPHDGPCELCGVTVAELQKRYKHRRYAEISWTRCIRPYYDHCHKPGHQWVRGMLCHSCNTIIDRNVRWPWKASDGNYFFSCDHVHWKKASVLACIMECDRWADEAETRLRYLRNCPDCQYGDVITKHARIEERPTILDTLMYLSVNPGQTIPRLKPGHKKLIMTWEAITNDNIPVSIDGREHNQHVKESFASQLSRGYMERGFLQFLAASLFDPRPDP